jgi:hypothetical protein
VDANPIVANEVHACDDDFLGDFFVDDETLTRVLGLAMGAGAPKSQGPGGPDIARLLTPDKCHAIFVETLEFDWHGHGLYIVGCTSRVQSTA